MDGIELKPFDVCKSWPIITASLFAFSSLATPDYAFSAITSRFPQLLKCDTNMVASYCLVPYLQHCYASLISYEQCST